MLTPRVAITKIEKIHEAFVVTFSLTGGALAGDGTEEVMLQIGATSTSIDKVSALAIRELRGLMTKWLEQLNA